MSKNEEEKIEEVQEEKAKKPKKKTMEEFEKEVLKLADKGLTAEKIGEELKKQGIHSKDYSKKIKDVLGAQYSSPDAKNIREKLDKLEKHVAKNHADKRAKRDKERVSAKLRRLQNYLKSK